MEPLIITIGGGGGDDGGGGGGEMSMRLERLQILAFRNMFSHFITRIHVVLNGALI